MSKNEDEKVACRECNSLNLKRTYSAPYGHRDAYDAGSERITCHDCGEKYAYGDYKELDKHFIYESQI
jgi:hypothetical protein